VLAGAAGTGCGGGRVEPGAGVTTSTVRSTVPHPTGASTTTVATGEVSIDEHAKNTTVAVSVGQRLVLRLHSTYWQDVASSDPSTLRLTGQAVTPQTPGTGCPPGGGCGTVTATFAAAAPGTATVSASRLLCGEAFQCPPADGSYTVQIKVDG
jgi:hypothetical protein